MKIASTAALLIQYLEGFQKEKEKVLKEKNSIKKGEKLFHLLAYDDSLKVIKNISVIVY